MHGNLCVKTGRFVEKKKRKKKEEEERVVKVRAIGSPVSLGCHIFADVYTVREVVQVIVCNVATNVHLLRPTTQLTPQVAPN
jgi:membrane-bound metal-dependent hydrolase YbcI (DUF457 family)